MAIHRHGHPVRGRLLALKPSAIASPRPSKANAEYRPRTMPSKIVQWTVVDMTFLEGQPNRQRRVDWPVDDRWTAAYQRVAMWRNTHGMKRSSKTT
ncbi:hypothetical protein [Mycobacterium sp. AT1]|uniref:hypothetical protein n=1 Tax=Mycobacterium sp. AT1 TaxID=1961706 RepID=UPI0009ABE319|nr:hypothetical protein [Mycobacterium sp. AT1]OPX11214.1 hypothetical protein B1790_08930 [Mycobacterium sp. AT1]